MARSTTAICAGVGDARSNLVSIADQRCAWYFAENCKGGATTFTATFSATTRFRAIYVAEYSGIATSGSFLNGARAEQTVPLTTTDAVTSGNANATSQPALVWGFGINVNGGTTPTAGTGFTSRTGVWSTATCLGRPEDKRATATGNVAATLTATTGTDPHATGVGIFAEAVSASVGSAASTSTAAGVGAASAVGVGSATSTSTAPAIAGNAGGVGSAASTSTVVAVGQATAVAVGAAAGSSTATGTGVALAVGVGSATSTSTALAMGSGTTPGSGVGSGSSTSTAVAVGSAIAVGVGAASGTSTALGVAPSASGVGAASGTSTATGVGAATASAAGSASGTSAAIAFSAVPAVVRYFGELARLNQTFGLLQQTGVIMIDLIGPIRVYRGDSLDLRLTVTNDADQRVNLTGVALELQIKPTLGGADPPTIAKAVGSGITLLAQSGATLGQADIAFSSADLDITPGRYWLDVVQDPTGARAHVVPPVEFTVRAVVNLL